MIQKRMYMKRFSILYVRKEKPFGRYEKLLL